MPRTYKTEGIVIKRINFGEADKLVTIFTKNHGKIVVLAKGIRKINSRKAPHLELFTHCQAFISHGRNLDIITESQTITSFSYFRTNLLRLSKGFGILEVIERLLPEREAHQDIYALFLQVIRQLNESKITEYQEITSRFLHEILWRLGYLQKDKILTEVTLYNFLEEVMEKRLKSSMLLTKIGR
jgi:DNA repair protein RecO (recombination protein O)